MGKRDSQDDPHSPHWADLAWSLWHHLDTTAQRGLVPRKRGIYRLRCKGRSALIYIGISDKLSSRLGGLRRARNHPPRYRGHSAAACVVQHEARGAIVEVSRTQLENVSRRELMGLEVDLIAACRARFGDSPACQFHGGPLE